jgi:hypothetical protein
MSPVKYELGFYIPEEDILHSHRRENLKYYIPPINLYSSVSMSICVTSYLNDKRMVTQGCVIPQGL